MCRDQGLLGVPFKGWNRLIRPLALQDLVNKVPVVVGFHYYTFFNWAINGKVVQLFLKKSQNQWLSHLRPKEWGVIVSDFILVLWTLYSDHKAKGKLLFLLKKLLPLPFRWRFMWSSQSFSSYFVPFDVKSYFHKRPKVLSYKYI